VLEHIKASERLVAWVQAGQAGALAEFVRRPVHLGPDPRVALAARGPVCVLAGAGTSLDRAAFARVYLVNFQDYAVMNGVYVTYFTPGRLPARTCVGVTGLALGALVEIDLIVKP